MATTETNAREEYRQELHRLLREFNMRTRRTPGY